MQGMPTLAPMLERVTPAVVNIASAGRIPVEQNPLFNDPFFRDFFGAPGQPLERKTQSLCKECQCARVWNSTGFCNRHCFMRRAGR